MCVNFKPTNKHFRIRKLKSRRRNRHRLANLEILVFRILKKILKSRLVVVTESGVFNEKKEQMLVGCLTFDFGGEGIPPELKNKVSYVNFQAGVLILGGLLYGVDIIAKYLGYAWYVISVSADFILRTYNSLNW